MKVPGSHPYLDALDPEARDRLQGHVLSVRDLRANHATTDAMSSLELELLADADLPRAMSSYRGLAEAARTRRDIEDTRARLFDAMAQVLEDAAGS